MRLLNLGNWAIMAVCCSMLCIVAAKAEIDPPDRSPHAAIEQSTDTGPDTVRVWDAIPYGGCATGQGQCATGQQCPCEACECEDCPQLPILELRIELGEPVRIEANPPSSDGGFAIRKTKARVRHVTSERCKFRC